jgi:seryl-tRNA synthetase
MNENTATSTTTDTTTDRTASTTRGDTQVDTRVESRPVATEFDVSAARDAFMDDLVKAGLLIPSGVAGINGRGAAFEWIVEGIVAAVAHRSAYDRAEKVRFPPVVTRANYLRSGHLKSFPHLAGSVHAFVGDDRAHRTLLAKADAGERWTDDLEPTEVVLTPAACYPLYPYSAGTVPSDGRLFDIQGYCFRHEPSNDPMRMQMFRQQEHVRIGTADQVSMWRDTWFERSQELLTDLGVTFVAEVANDPFFGRSGKLMAASQREQALKFELNVPIIHPDHPTACVSLNAHEDHFGHEFGIFLADGSYAQTSCIGFGLERLTLALLRRYGLDPQRWPNDVRSHLEP